MSTRVGDSIVGSATESDIPAEREEILNRARYPMPPATVSMAMEPMKMLTQPTISIAI
jgi:hypothetical protein